MGQRAHSTWARGPIETEQLAQLTGHWPTTTWSKRLKEARAEGSLTPTAPLLEGTVAQERAGSQIPSAEKNFYKSSRSCPCPIFSFRRFGLDQLSEQFAHLDSPMNHSHSSHDQHNDRRPAVRSHPHSATTDRKSEGVQHGRDVDTRRPITTMAQQLSSALADSADAWLPSADALFLIQVGPSPSASSWSTAHDGGNSLPLQSDHESSLQIAGHVALWATFGLFCIYFIPQLVGNWRDPNRLATLSMRTVALYHLGAWSDLVQVERSSGGRMVEDEVS